MPTMHILLPFDDPGVGCVASVPIGSEAAKCEVEENMTEYLFKATDGYQATNGGDYRYRLNRWTRHEKIDPCVSGWHLARNQQILHWLSPTLWLAEACPDHEPVDHGDKVVTCKTRLVERLDTWNDRTARLFAADCAETALALASSPDPRSVEAVRVARLFAEGEASLAELDAARDAAWSAAWSAAESAARAVQYRNLLRYLELPE